MPSTAGLVVASASAVDVPAVPLVVDDPRSRAAVPGLRIPRGRVNAKAKGTRNEHRSRLVLEAAGYRVTRAAGSLGDWDLIGVSLQDVVLVQVKTRDWPGAVESRTLTEFPAPPIARKILHRWRSRRRIPDVREL